MKKTTFLKIVIVTTAVVAISAVAITHRQSEIEKEFEEE